MRNIVSEAWMEKLFTFFIFFQQWILFFLRLNTWEAKNNLPLARFMVCKNIMKYQGQQQTPHDMESCLQDFPSSTYNEVNKILPIYSWIIRRLLNSVIRGSWCTSQCPSVQHKNYVIMPTMHLILSVPKVSVCLTVFLMCSPSNKWQRIICVEFVS